MLSYRKKPLTPHKTRPLAAIDTAGSPDEPCPIHNRRSRPTAPCLPITRAPENLHLGQHPVVVRWPEHPALRAARLVEDDAARDHAAAGVRAGGEQDEVHAPRREGALVPYGLPDREARGGGVGLSEGVDETERGDEVPDSLRLLGRVEIAHEEQRGGAWAGAQDTCDPLRMAVAPVEVGRAGLERAPVCGELGAYEHPPVEAAAPVDRVGMRGHDREAAEDGRSFLEAEHPRNERPARGGRRVDVVEAEGAGQARGDV